VNQCKNILKCNTFRQVNSQNTERLPACVYQAGAEASDTGHQPEPAWRHWWRHVSDSPPPTAFQCQVYQRWDEMWTGLHDQSPAVTYHHHHFWFAPLWAHSVTQTQQPPERAILRHIDCFSQCEIMGLKVIQDCLHPCDPRATGWSPPTFLRECSQDLLNILTVSINSTWLLVTSPEYQ